MKRPRDRRFYISVEVTMPDHPKVEELSDRAFRALVTLWCWCAANRTDGEVNAASWRKRAPGRAGRELVAAGLVEERPDGSVWMHDYLEHQPSRDAIDSLSQARSEAGSRGGKAKAQRVASATASARQTGSNDLADKKTDTSEPNGSDATPRLDVERLCTRLADRIEANGSKRPRITQAWRDAARRLLDLDTRTEDQVARAIDWCQGDEFWRGNVLSMPTLRERYDQLRLQAERQRAGGRATSDDRVASIQALKGEQQLQLGGRVVTRDEVIDLLTIIAVADKRTVGEPDVVLWEQCVGDLDFTDARQAVLGHFREATAWLMPVHVRDRVRAIRGARLAAQPDPMPDVDPDDVQAYQRRRRELRAAAASPHHGGLITGGTP